jgi:hypothetical protein
MNKQDDVIIVDLPAIYPPECYDPTDKGDEYIPPYESMDDDEIKREQEETKKFIDENLNIHPLWPSSLSEDVTLSHMALRQEVMSLLKQSKEAVFAARQIFEQYKTAFMALNRIALSTCDKK